MAIGAVATLAVTGLYSAWLHIGSPDLLPRTTYGQALLIKSALFAALVGFGALHLFVARPQLNNPRSQWPTRIRHTLRAEIVAGVLLLLAVGALTSVAPSKTAWQAQKRLGQRMVAQVDTVGLVLWVAPGSTGDNLIALDLHDERPAAEVPPEVLFRFSMDGMQMGVLQEQARESGAGRFVARGSYMNMSGRWAIEAIVRRPGMDDVRHTFLVDLRTP